MPPQLHSTLAIVVDVIPHSKRRDWHWKGVDLVRLMVNLEHVMRMDDENDDEGRYCCVMWFVLVYLGQFEIVVRIEIRLEGMGRGQLL